RFMGWLGSGMSSPGNSRLTWRFSDPYIFEQREHMPRLVLLSEGFTGRTYDIKVDKTTVGRVEDNAFQITDGSVSSHHAEILLRGNDVVINDLNSTNGTFINGEKVTGENVLKPGQTLRLGQVEMRLEVEGMPTPPAPAPSTPAPAISPVPPK